MITLETERKCLVCDKLLPIETMTAVKVTGPSPLHADIEEFVCTTCWPITADVVEKVFDVLKV